MNNDTPVIPQIDSSAKHPMRNPHWEEMNDSEKIAALRETVVWLSRDLTDANKAIIALSRHQHATDGSLLGPLHASVGGMNESVGYSRNYAHNLMTARERGR